MINNKNTPQFLKMTIRELCSQHPLYGAERSVQERADNIISGLLYKMSNSTLSPQEIINIYFQDAILADFEKDWQTHIKHTIKVGRKSEHILMQSIGQYRLTYYIEQAFNFVIHPKNFQFISYTQSKFAELARMETAMLVTKYQDLNEFEVKFAIVKLLFSYFSVYSQNGYTGKYQWNVTSAEINAVINSILDSDVSELKQYIDIISPGLQILVPQKAVKAEKDTIKPKCAEDLLECIDETMTQQEKRRAIMLAWNLPTERAARSYMQKFGLTRNYSKTTKSDKTNQPDTMNIIQEYEQQIIQLKNQVADLITLNERLREENNYLRAGIVQSQKEPEQKKESTTVVSKTDFPQMSAEESEKLRDFFAIHG